MSEVAQDVIRDDHIYVNLPFADPFMAGLAQDVFIDDHYIHLLQAYSLVLHLQML